MKDFNGKNLYALSYGENGETKKIILYVSNGTKVMLFDENSIKTEKHKSLEFSVPVSSIALNSKYIAIGFSDGTLKIFLNNEAKTVIH